MGEHCNLIKSIMLVVWAIAHLMCVGEWNGYFSREGGNEVVCWLHTLRKGSNDVWKMQHTFSRSPPPFPVGSPSDGTGHISLLWSQHEWSWKKVWLIKDWYLYRLPFDFIDHSYRSSSEVQAVRKEKDAIKLVEAYALNGELATVEELKVLNHCKETRYTSSPPSPQELLKSAKAEVKEAVAFATSGSELPPSELYTHIHSDQDEMGLYIRGCDPFTSNTSQAQP